MPVLLFVSYSGAFGGAERLLVDFAGGLQGELCVACPEGRLGEEARAAGMRVFPIRRYGLHLRGSARGRILAVARLAAHALEVRAITRNLDPDLVLVWGMRSAVACLLPRPPRPPRARAGSRAPAPVPVVFQHNDLLPAGAVGPLVRAAARRADQVVTLSQAIADDLDPRGRMHPPARVVHPGVDVDSFSPAPIEAPDGLGPAEVLVLGALVDWKAPELALEACALARGRHHDLRLRFVGAPFKEDGDEILERLRRRASRPDLAGAVEFAGSVSDPRPELARATCLLHCAPREPFGLVVLEALATGRPVVVPAAAGPAEIADASCGLLYPPGNAAAAGAALGQMLADPAEAARMGSRGRDRARRHFDRALALERYSEAVMPSARGRVGPGGGDGAGLSGGASGNRAGLSRGDSGDRAGRAALAIVTVTHNSAPWLRLLLASVERHLPGVRVVVVDCASDDDSVEVARRWHSRSPVAVAVVELSENAGFGRACNRGLSEVREPITAMLNPDVELVDDSLLALASEALARDRPERLLAPLVLTPSGSRQDSVHPVPGSLADLVRTLVPPRGLPVPLGLPVAPWRASRPRRVGWAVGCALVGRSETLRRLGPFDERIFLYGEDLDLGLRAATAGVDTWFFPAARVLHDRAHSTSREFGGEPFEALARGRHEVVARRLGDRTARLDDSAQAITFRSRAALKRALGRPAQRERRQLEALGRVRRAAG